MKIANIVEMINFIKTHELHNNLESFANLYACIEQFKSICSCESSTKGKKLDECMTKYESCINLLTSDQRFFVLTKSNNSRIEFYNQNKLISIISL